MIFLSIKEASFGEQAFEITSHRNKVIVKGQKQIRETMKS